MYNPYLPKGDVFRSTLSFLWKMEDLLNGMQCPQPFMADRTFGAVPARPVDRPMETQQKEGRCATFAIRVIFRQNATWQGTVSWLEAGREARFRSALELLKIMDSALAEAESQKNPRSCFA